MTAFLSNTTRRRPFWKKGLSLHVVLGQRGRVIRISPLLLLLATFTLGVVAYQFRLHLKAQEAYYQSRIEELEKDKKRVQTMLQRKDREKKQALALAESRSAELWGEIRSRDQQMEQLWEAVGKPKKSVPKAYRSIHVSRGGMRTL